MSRSRRAAMALFVGVVPGTAASIPAAAAPSNTGPSTTTAPYVLPVAAGVEITSILTVADDGAASNGYEMVGIPDGLGAQRQGTNLIVNMNHELGQTQGIARAHGQAGAFVSRLVIDPATLSVREGSDWIRPGVQYWDYPNGALSPRPDAYGTGSTADLPSFARFCSGDLTEAGQLYNASTQNGYKGAVYFANEEVGPDGRVFAVLKDGTAVQLPRLGLFSWENTLGAFNDSDTTVVMGDEDQSNIAGQNVSQLWVYVGTKQKSGTPVDKAGLTNGENHVVTIPDGDPTNDPDPINDGALRALIAADPDRRVEFGLSEVGWDQSGTAQNDEALAEGMSLNRIEDGEFDPNDKNVFYFVTTEGSPANPPETPARDGGGLWRLTFEDVEDPELGGTLELLLDGTESIFSAAGAESNMNKPDNMTIDAHGNVLIQEDPGGNAHVARIVAYRISDGALGVVARFDPALFSGTMPLTIDEESSGIIDTEAVLGAGTFLFDAQVHTNSGLDNPVAQVERGQLMQLFVPDWNVVYGS
jgi:hypothetical protein